MLLFITLKCVSLA